MNDAKSIFASKTFWANAASIIGGIALCVTGNVAAGVPMIVSGVGNIGLRTMTDTPVKLR